MRPVLVRVDHTEKPAPPDPDGRRLRPRFKDLLDPRLIPRLPVESEELELLRTQQLRLVAAYESVGEDARRAGDTDAYERAKADALLTGGPEPEQPLTRAEVEAGRERAERDGRAARAAILRWGRELVTAVRSHPEWRGGGGGHGRGQASPA